MIDKIQTTECVLCGNCRKTGLFVLIYVHKQKNGRKMSYPVHSDGKFAGEIGLQNGMPVI